MSRSPAIIIGGANGATSRPALRSGTLHHDVPLDYKARPAQQRIGFEWAAPAEALRIKAVGKLPGGDEELAEQVDAFGERDQHHAPAQPQHATKLGQDNWQLGGRDDVEHRGREQAQSGVLRRGAGRRRPRAVAGLAVRNPALPPGALLVTVERGAQTIVPHGSTVLAAGDQVTVFAPPPQLEAALAALRGAPQEHDAHA